MLSSSLVTIFIAIILGFLAGLGVGGGSLLMLWLTFILGMDHSTARGINLLFFLPSALVACLFRWKQGTIDFKIVLPGIIGGCIAAGVCSWFSAKIEMDLVKKLFGGLLILTGLREIFYQGKRKSPSS